MTPKWLIAGMVHDWVYHISPHKFSRSGCNVKDESPLKMPTALAS